MRVLGIRAKVLLLALLPATVSALLLGGYQLMTATQALQQALDERGQAIVEQLAPAAEYAVFSGNTPVLEQLAQAALRGQDVVGVTLRDADNRVLVQRVQAEADPAADTVSQGRLFTAPIRRTTLPVMQGFAETTAESPTILGRVEVVLSTRATAQRQRGVIRTSLLLLLGCLGIAGAVGRVLSRQITVPILQLETTVHRLQDGDLGTRLEVRSTGELGNLEAGINAMATALQASHRDLEQRIAVATQELRAALAERANRQRELEEAHRQAEQAARVKAEFLANMSHEIRTPLHGVTGFISLLTQTELSATQVTAVNALQTAANSLLATINSILDFSKLEAGKVTLAQKPFALRETLTATVHLFIPMAEAKGLALSLDMSPDLPLAVIGDAQRLTQIIGNLVSNAIKFTYRGEVKVAVRRWDGAPGEIGLRLTVRDTGIGMAPEEQLTLFEAFNQVDASTTRQQGGTGLGLAICQQLVTLMGGQLTVESQVGMGTAFHVTLDFQLPDEPARNPTQGDAAGSIPIIPPTAEAKKLSLSGEEQDRHAALRPTTTVAAQRQPLSGGIAQPRPRVLVVDDQELNRLLAQLVLEDLDAIVDLASNGWEALAACQRTCYDLILMDVRLPGLDGLETTRAIRQLVGNPNQRIPIIALTADVLHETPETLRAAGMTDILYKPIQVEDLKGYLQR
ncbi:MAG TPA: ATP-binding protein, partial [Candidatus Competibacteraceae bacterium]|nr:ATP-binding protein [Candidatus Competibacteraceae bacterium]